MPKFDLSSYETVEERIRRFYEDNPDGRIVTHNQTTVADRSVSTWVVYTQVFLTAGDQANDLPKATGLAFEVDGTPGANQTAALENAETSSIGRALANAGYSGSKRSSREEMSKANRGVTPPPVSRDFMAEASKLSSLDDLRNLWLEAKTAKAPKQVLDKIQEMANGSRSASSVGDGDQGSLRPSSNKGQ